MLGQQLRGVLQVHAAAVENHERRGGNRVVFQPAANRPVDLRGVLRRGVSSRADRPHGLIRNRHARLAVALAQRGLELPRHDLQRVAGLALLERLTDAEHRLQVGRERRSDFFFGVGVRLAEDVTTLGVADQSESGAALFGERSGGGSGERAFGLPIEVLRSDRDVAVTRDSLRDRLDRHGRWEEPHGPLVRDLPRRKKGPQVLAGLLGRHKRIGRHLPHFQRCHDAQDLAADISQTDEAQRAARQAHSHVIELFAPASRASQAIFDRQLVRQG